jgi:hypothetical protein
MQGAGVGQRGSDSGLRLVMHDLMRPVMILPLWTFTGSDLTLVGGASGLLAARPVLCFGGVGTRVTYSAQERLLAVGIVRQEFEAGDTWRSSVDRTLGAVRPVTMSCTSGRPDFSTVREPTALFRWDSLYKRGNRHGLSLGHFY